MRDRRRRFAKGLPKISTVSEPKARKALSIRSRSHYRNAGKNFSASPSSVRRPSTDTRLERLATVPREILKSFTRDLQVDWHLLIDEDGDHFQSWIGLLDVPFRSSDKYELGFCIRI